MSVRVTKKIRRILDLLAKGPVTASEINDGTNIKYLTLWPLLERLAAAGWITLSDRQWTLTPAGRAGLKQAREDEKAAHVASWPDAHPRGPHPPHRSVRPMLLGGDRTAYPRRHR